MGRRVAALHIAIRLIGLAAAFAAVLPAAGPRRGASDYRHPLSLQLKHQQNIAARSSRGLPLPLARSSRKLGKVSQERITGDIAVIDDGDGVYLPALPFDLDNRSLDFAPAAPLAAEYTYAASDGGFDAAAAAGGGFLALGDDDAIRMALPFSFPFFGKSYQSVFINSDGNLTFGQADTGTSARDVVRAVVGPPRILPLFADLDPTQPGSAVRALAAGDRLVVTWVNVPLFSTGGGGASQTFQVTLFAEGGIRFSYGGVTATTFIIGLASGERLNDSQAVDFTEPSSEPFVAATIEIFLPADLDLGVLSQKFYLSHEDAYDFLVVFHNYDIGIDTGAFAFYTSIRNYDLGIGPAPEFAQAQNVFDFGAIVGSPFRQQGLMFMGELSKYSDDPAARIGRGHGLGTSTPLTVLAHEAGHRYLARILFAEPESNLLSAELLGRDFSHWSYYFNSNASLLEGNRIADRGAEPFRFETTETIAGYSPLDLYLMGLVPPDEVPATFYVARPSIEDSLFNRAHEPLAGVLFDGERKDLTIGMVRAANGRRIPDHTVSQKAFRYAFILLTKEGETARPADIEKLERLRVAFENYVEGITGGRADVETRLVRQLTFTSWPASGVMQGSSIAGTVFVNSPAAAPLTVRLRDETGRLGIRAEVTIPAGSRFADFDIEGRNSGVGRLTGEIDAGFEAARANIQVLADPSRLSPQRILPLELIFGDPSERLRTGHIGQPLPYSFFILVRDDNLLPYANVAVEAAASGDGFVEPAELLTDEFGFVVFDWTLATAQGENTLEVRVKGSTRPPLVLTAVGTRDPPRQRNPLRFIFPR
jgi:hypothetical protein